MSIEIAPQAPHTTITPPEEKAVPDHEDTKYVNVFDLCQDVDITLTPQVMHNLSRQLRRLCLTLVFSQE